MTWLNHYEIDERVHQYVDHPVLGPATRTLANLRDVVDANSDGWCYWPKPQRAASNLCRLIAGDGTARYRFGERDDVTPEGLAAALRPVKAFRTRSKLDFVIESAEAPGTARPVRPNTRRSAMPNPTNPTILMDSYVTINGSFSLSGERHATALVDAVVAAYPRPSMAGTLAMDGTLAGFAGTKVTLLMHADMEMGAKAIIAFEGSLFDHGTAFMPKGNRRKGIRLDAAKVLDVTPGYGKTPLMAKRLETCRARFPKLAALTQERLGQLPTAGSVCSLGVFGTWRLPDNPDADVVYLACEYDKANDIVEGVLFYRSGYSESGSCYGRDLLTVGGEIVDLPAGVTLGDALAMIDWDHDDVLAFVRGDGPPASSAAAPATCILDEADIATGRDGDCTTHDHEPADPPAPGPVEFGADLIAPDLTDAQVDAAAIFDRAEARAAGPVEAPAPSPALTDEHRCPGLRSDAA